MRVGSWSIHATIHGEADANGTWTNMPAAETFLFNSHRYVTMIDLTGMSHGRLKVNKQTTAGNAGAKLILRFAYAFSIDVADYLDIGAAECSVAIDTTNAYLDSGWVELTTPHQDVYLAIIGSGGNGVLDPAFGNISVAFT